MRKILLAACFSLTCFCGIQAQEGIYQFADPGFEQYSSGNEPGNGWNSFASATGSLSNFKGNSPQSSSYSPGANGSKYAVQIYSKSILGQKANGNLTTGVINMGSMTPANAANYNFTRRSDATHSLRFAGRPDAVTFYAKFSSGGSPNGRAQFILHDDCDYRDPEISDQAGNRIGKASVAIPASSDWVKYEGKFSYDRTQPSVQYLLASVTTNPTAGGSSGDYLQIDEIRFVYYHTLSGLNYQGANIQFSEDKTSYDLSTTAFENSKLSYTVKGAGATAEHSYDAETGLLTITVKGDDYAVNAQSKTVYTVRFAVGGNSSSSGVGDFVSSPADISMRKTYLLYNEHFTTYAIYNETYSETALWTAGMIGDDSHAVSSETYAEPVDVTSAGSSWMVISHEGKYYLYNMEAQRYLSSPGADTSGEASYFSESPVALTMVELGNGKFAFTASGAEKDYICVSPQLSIPVSNWESSDAGAAWQLIENPNIEADLDVVREITGEDPLPSVSDLGEKISSLKQIDMRKTYVLYNEHFTTYAIHNATHSDTHLWTAGMTGDDAHAVSSSAYSEALDVAQPGSAWMVMTKDGKYYLYNLGAQRYLSSPGADTHSEASYFSESPVELTIVELGNGNFAFTASGAEKDYICVSPQLPVPVSNWESNDAGAAWQLIENPFHEADLEVVEALVGPLPQPLGETLKSLDEVSIEKTYVLYNKAFTAYAVYDAANSDTYVWSAEMTGDEAHPLARESYSQELNIMNAGSSWMVVPHDGKVYLYNMGAGKYLTTPGYAAGGGTTAPCRFSTEAVPLMVVALEDGQMAFSTTGEARDYMCAAPQMSAGPIGIWQNDDAGAAWLLRENPNVAADPSIASTLTAIAGVSVETTTSEIYTLTGTKVSALGKNKLPRGIYIVGGKKMFIGH